MNDDYIKFLANNLFFKLNESERSILVNYLIKVLSTEKINIEFKFEDYDLSSYLLLLCLKLIEKNEKQVCSRILIDSFKMIKRQDLAKELTKFLDINSDKYNLNDKNNNSLNQIQLLDQTFEIGFKPYKFQLSLAQNGCKHLNNIICVRTGSGKTLIASLICKYWYEKYKKSFDLDKFKVCFIVPTRNLVSQQADVFKNSFDCNDLVEIDEKSKDLKIKNLFDMKKILFMTPQKLINTIENTDLKLKDFKIIIFDECHHTNDNHPYNEIMKIYFQEMKNNQTNMPLIIGLTASLGIGKKFTAVDHLINLCANLDCRLISTLTDINDIEDLNKNIPSQLDDKMINVSLGLNMRNLIERIKYVSLTILNKVKIPIIKFKLGVPEYENFLVLENQTAAISNNRNLIIAIKYLIELNIFYLRIEDFPIDYCLVKLKEFVKINQVEKPIELELFCQNSVASLIEYIESNKLVLDKNPKLEKLVETILGFHKLKSRGLILVRTRNHTKALRDYLNEHSQIKNNNIKAGFLVGQGCVDGISMNENQQRTSLDEFRKGIFNLLVATDIAQEGLDVPECNYVIRYEFVSNEIGTVQSRGRCRAHKGQIVLITSEGSLNQKREFENRIKEEEMNNAIKTLRNIDMKLFEEKYNKIRDEILKKINFQNSLQLTTNYSTAMHSSHVDIHCKNCSKFLFNGQHLRFREPSYFSVCKIFSKNLIITDNEKKKFFCSDSSCKNELGQLVEIRRSTPLFMINIKGVKFCQPDNKMIIYSKWSNVRSMIDIQDF